MPGASEFLKKKPVSAGPTPPPAAPVDETQQQDPFDFSRYITDPRDGSSRGAERRTVRPALPADHLSPLQPDRRRRGAAAVEASGQGHDQPQRLHSDRRRDRPDVEARRLGPETRHDLGRALAGYRSHDQPVAGPVLPERSGNPAAGADRRDRRLPDDGHAGNHRRTAARTLAPHHGDAAGDPGPRVPDRAGRFRHRLLQPELSGRVPLRQAEDRPQLRQRDLPGRIGPDRGAGGHPPRPCARHGSGCRGRRNRDGQRHHALLGQRSPAGLLLLEAAAGRGTHRLHRLV